MTFAQLQTFFDAQWKRSGQVSTTNRDLWLNLGYKQFCSETDCLKGRVSFSAIADCGEYTIPDTCNHIIGGFLDDRPLDEFSEATDYYYYGEGRRENSIDELSAYRFTVIDYDGTTKLRRLGLLPVPSESAMTALVNDAATVLAAATSITYDTASDDFPDRGIVIIDSEVIYYTYKSSTQLLGCIRGMEGTTAAIHANNATITLRNINLLCSKIPVDLSNSTDTPISIDESYQLALPYFALSLAYAVIERTYTASYWNNEFQKLTIKYREDEEWLKSKGKTGLQLPWSVSGS